MFASFTVNINFGVLSRKPYSNLLCGQHHKGEDNEKHFLYLSYVVCIGNGFGNPATA
jgi:hypothetical protein